MIDGKERRRSGESQRYEIVNKERKSRRRINEEIELKEWKEYFMGLLGEEEERISREKVGEEEVERIGVGREQDISKEEIKEALRRMRIGKASGIDEIPNELWKGGEELEGWIVEFCKEYGEEKDGQRNERKE